MIITVDVGSHTRFCLDKGSRIEFSITGWGQTLVDETDGIPLPIKGNHEVNKDDSRFLAFNLSTFPMIINVQ